jgi:hypothetical protein
MSYDFEPRLLELGVPADFFGQRPPPVSDAEIERFELKIGGRLPGDYRAFIQTYGGYWPEKPHRLYSALWCWCPCSEPTPFGEHGLVTFLSFNQVESLRDFSEIIPPHMIPIAEGHFGACTCLAFKGDDAGSVFALDTEFRYEWPDDDFHRSFANLSADIAEWLSKRAGGELPPKKPGYEHLYHVADSFTGFLDRLKPMDWGEEK